MNDLIYSLATSESIAFQNFELYIIFFKPLLDTCISHNNTKS